jgi:glucose/arabinose dehydrogenase
MRPRRTLACVAVILVGLLLLPAPPPAVAASSTSRTTDWAHAKATRMAEDLNFPADFAFAPDGSVWFVEKMGSNVTRLDLATGATRVMWHAPDAVEARDERGMLGLAFDPDADADGPFYVYYTQRNGEAEGGINRLLRIDGETVEVLLEGITAWQEHNGGKIVFAPDKTMFVSIGENSKGKPAQDPDSLLGKILHMTRDAQPVAGNLKGLVYSMGHRNPYGLAYDPATKTLYEDENSGWQRDEVNLVKPGGNYGYPMCEGYYEFDSDTERCPGQYEAPLGQFTNNSTVAPVGMAVFRGDVYWASWNLGVIHRIAPPPAGRDARPWLDEIVFKTNPWERLLDLEPGPDGRSLWFSTMSELWRIDLPPLGDTEPPPPPPPTNTTNATRPPPKTNGTVPGTNVELVETPRGLPDASFAAGAMALCAVAWATRRRRS